MKIDDFKKAEDIVSKIDAIEDLIKEHTLGRVSNSKEFTKNNDDFYNAKFINVFETKGHHDTGGGISTLGRLTIAKYNDMSGAKYHLTKGEIIQLQSFLSSMLENRLNTLKKDLDNI